MSTRLLPPGSSKPPEPPSGLDVTVVAVGKWHFSSRRFWRAVKAWFRALFKL